MRKRPQHDVLHDRAGLANHRELPASAGAPRQPRCLCTADEKQMLRLGLDQDVLQQIERRGVEPLEIVEEERQRMLGAREHTDQPKKSCVEARLCVRRRKFWNRRLLADHELAARE